MSKIYLKLGKLLSKTHIDLKALINKNIKFLEYTLNIYSLNIGLT